MKSKFLETVFELKSMDDQGVFTGYASVFGITDQVKDRVQKGAFKKSLQNHREQNINPPLLWQHDVHEPIGAWREIYEDEYGLFVRGELFIEDIPKAKQAYKLLSEGAVSGLSIGFKTRQSELNPRTGERVLTQLDLLEISVVTFPALGQARVSHVKSCLGAGLLPNEREFEVFLRDVGFSRKQAKNMIASGYRSVFQRDAAQQKSNTIQAHVELLSAKLRQWARAK